MKILDGLLGEDGVAGWIGEIHLRVKEPPGTVAADALPDIVRDLAQRHAEPTWALFETTDDTGAPVHVAARRPLKRVDWPLLDPHGRVTITIRSAEECDPRIRQPLQELEDDLLAALDGHALLAAHETRGGQRVLHLYCDSQGHAPTLVEEWRAARPSAPIATSWARDPGWEAIRPHR
jgi:hypothetical protein